MFFYKSSVLRIKIPTYTGKDYHIMVATMLPLALMINGFMFGKRYFTEWKMLSAATVVTFGILALVFILYGMVASAMRNRLPREDQLMKRQLICIAIFLLMSAVILSIVFRGYEYFNFLDRWW